MRSWDSRSHCGDCSWRTSETRSSWPGPPQSAWSPCSPCWSHDTCEISSTAKNQYRKLETNIPRNGIARPQSQFPHSCVYSIWAIYIFPRWICLFCCRIYVDRSWEYINAHRDMNVEIGTEAAPLPRKGIQKRDFRCSAGYKVQYKGSLFLAWSLLNFQKKGKLFPEYFYSMRCINIDPYNEYPWFSRRLT